MQRGPEKDQDHEREITGSERRSIRRTLSAQAEPANIAWAEKIEQMLKGSGVQQIAVGAGHLVGPESVQA